MAAKALSFWVAGATIAWGAPTECEVEFKKFVAKYDRVYRTLEEEKLRLEIFAANYKFIQDQNAANHSYKLEVNEFADQSSKEFRSSRFGLSLPAIGKFWVGVPRLGTDRYSGAPLPDSIDWSTKGAVTPPKNQQQCGSCWAFSTTGALEGAWKIASGKLVSLSEQQLVDCSSHNNACGGGTMDVAFDFVEQHSMCTEASYPYASGASKTAGACKTNCTEGIPKGSVTGYYDVPVDDMKALMEAVVQQPVSVAIEADQTAFQMYSNGILTKTCGEKLDHGVLLVGYGSENGVDYWKVKNSWGASWGEGGFVRIERGLASQKAGECGIKGMASYPQVKATPIVVV